MNGDATKEAGLALTARRREMLKLTGLAALRMASTVAAPAMAQQTLAWDKTFPKSDRVDHRKVSYTNRLGITLVADLYVPRGLEHSRRHPALVVGTPFGAVKEQASASEPKELFIVPNAGHVDLYDRVNLIPWDKLRTFFDRNLSV